MTTTLRGLGAERFTVSNVAPKFEVPSIKIDTSVLVPNLEEIAQSATKALEPAMNAWAYAYRDQFADIAKNLQRILGRGFPPNWQGQGGEHVELPDNLETILLDEGLPVAWVPPRPILLKLFAANSAQGRRTVISNNRRGILNACVAELEVIKEPSLREYVEFTAEAAESLRAGHWRSSQALSANLTDSILHRCFDRASKKELTNQNALIDWSDYPIRPALVFGAVWGSYGAYWPDKGDPIPRKYTRHASAHGVSRRQYTRLNSVIALMHVVGLLRVVESDLDESGR